MQQIILLLLSCLIISLAGCSKTESLKFSTIATEKKPAPDISVQSITNGTTLKLSELKGKVVMLNFWATWCPPCRDEIPSMMKLNTFMAGKPFQIVAISIDEGGKPAIDAFFKETGFSLPTYQDTSGTSSKAYGVTGVPETFIIDKQGILVKKIIGGAAWDSPEVVAFLENLMK